MAVTKVLKGYTSQQNAYLVEDYPYGFRLRCKIRYWLEYKHGHGYRLVSQTTDPRKPIEVWNKPKASTYTHYAAMFLDENNHVQWTGIALWDGHEKMQAFLDTYREGLDTTAIVFIEKHIAASKAREAAKKGAE